MAAAELEPGVPARRGTEFLAGLPVGAQLVVGRAFLGIPEYLVGLADFLEALFGIRLVTDIRVILARQFLVGALDLILGGILRDPHDLVVVFVLHRMFRGLLST